MTVSDGPATREPSISSSRLRVLVSCINSVMGIERGIVSECGRWRVKVGVVRLENHTHNDPPQQ